MQQALQLIEQRVSVNRFDPDHTLSQQEIEQLVRLATRAPTAFNLQNWRFIAVQSTTLKQQLFTLSYEQRKVMDAAVTFIICGQLPNAEHLSQRLEPFLETGLMPKTMANDWQKNAQALYSHPETARDEAIRSATLGTATLMYAAEAMGWSSGPMIGFDHQAVSNLFSLGADEIPVLMLPVGHSAEGNWPQKPRRPLSEVLDIL